MKKILTLLSVSSLLLGACGAEEEGADQAPAEETTALEEDTETDLETETETETGAEGKSLEQQAGDVIEDESGKRTIISQVENINETQVNGPFEITLLHSQLSQLQPSPDYVNLFGGEDLALITFQIEVTNTSPDTNSIYPNQGTAVTDNGHQVDAALLLSDDVGGDFYGEVTKTGDVFFIYDGDASEVSSVRYIIRSSHGEDFESFGEDLEFIVNFE